MPQETARGMPRIVRLTERLLVSAFTIKSDLDKAMKVWEDNFRDPVKAALLAGPQAVLPAQTEVSIGGVRAAITKTFPKDGFNTANLAATVSCGIRDGQLGTAEIRLLLETGAIVVARPADVLAVLCPRMRGVQAVDYVIPAVNPEVPTVVSLRLSLVPDLSTTPVGVLHDVPERVSVAAAGSTNRLVDTPAGAPITATMAAALAIDAANTARATGVPVQLAEQQQHPAPTVQAPDEVAVRRQPRRPRPAARRRP